MRHLDPVDIFLTWVVGLFLVTGGMALYEWAVTDDPVSGFGLIFVAYVEYRGVTSLLLIREDRERRRALEALRT